MAYQATDSAYTAWWKAVKAAGGTATTWPFKDQYERLAAARYSGARYAQLYNAHQIDPAAPQRAANSNQYIYVLAGADVQATSPKTMTTWQRFLNAGFSWGDASADALGLPSLKTIEKVLNPFDLSVGKLAIGAAVLAAAVIVLPRLLPGRRS